jgi:hypothetical protein
MGGENQPRAAASAPQPLIELKVNGLCEAQHNRKFYVATIVDIKTAETAAETRYQVRYRTPNGGWESQLFWRRSDQVRAAQETQVQLAMGD